MTRRQKTTGLPPEALRVIEKEAQREWGEGEPLVGLLARVNKVAELITPQPGEGSAKVKPHFTERSLRHYQTLGAIDPPAKAGRVGLYGYRHLLQALLVRKLLWQRIPADRISDILADRSNTSLNELLVGAGASVDEALVESNRGRVDLVETWYRIRLAPGVELLLEASAPKPGRTQLGGILEAAERQIRDHFR